MDRQRVLKVLPDYPNINKYMGPIIKERLLKPNWQSSPILRIFLDPDNSPDNLEEQLLKTRDSANFRQVFKISLGADDEPDEKINDVLAEVRALSHLLNQRRFGNVAIVPQSQTKTVDITANYEHLNFAIEVKHPRGPEFKHHTPIGNRGAYRLDQQQKIKKGVRRQVRGALQQINEFRDKDPARDYQGMVLVVETRMYVTMFYQKCIEQAIKETWNHPPSNLDLTMVASIDFIDPYGDLSYFHNPHWAKKKTDIWPPVEHL